MSMSIMIELRMNLDQIGFQTKDLLMMKTTEVHLGLMIVHMAVHTTMNIKITKDHQNIIIDSIMTALQGRMTVLLMMKIHRTSMIIIVIQYIAHKIENFIKMLSQAFCLLRK